MFGQKLKSARLARGLSLEQLATALARDGSSVSKAALSKYEREQSVPPSSLLCALAAALQVDPAYFFEQPRNRVAWGDFRKSARLGSKSRLQLQAAASHAVDSLVWLEETLLVRYELSVTRNSRLRVSDLNDVEEAAEHIRAKLGLDSFGPIIGLLPVLERSGVILLSSSLVEDTNFDGLSGWLNETRPLIVTRANAPIDRLRFSVAHELGHLVLDCDHFPEKQREEFAHRFASAFLVSRASAVLELGEHRRNLSLAELGLLKRKYGLSIQAWVRRAFDLGIINESLYKKLFIELSERGWRRSEPAKYDYRGLEETSHLQQYTLRALNEGLISLQRARELCPSLVEPALSPVGAALSAAELLRLPAAERDEILEAAATRAVADYLDNAELTDFVADDFIEY